MRRLTAFTIAALLALTLTPASQTTAQARLKPVTLMLNWIPYGEHAPFYYGLAKGYYAAQGIDLTIESGGGSAKTIQAVGAGTVAFGYADTPTLIQAIAKGVPVKSIGVVLQRTPSAVQLFADKHVTTPAGLRGMTIALTPGDALYQTFPAFLEANHMTPADVNLVNIDPAGKNAALISGRADAIVGYYNGQAPEIEAATGKKVVAIEYAANGVNFYGDGLITSDATLSSDPALVRGFVSASRRAWADAALHPREAVAEMEKRVDKAPGADVMLQELTISNALLHTKNTVGRDPIVNVPADWQATIDLLARYAGLTNPAKPDAYWIDYPAGSSAAR
jgi:NitT/TauT family transport system substrate-binding protein